MTNQRNKAFAEWWAEFLRGWGTAPSAVNRSNPLAGITARAAWDAAREKYEVLEDIADKYGYECPKCGAPLNTSSTVGKKGCTVTCPCGFHESPNATPATPPKVPADCPKCGMQLRLDGECVQCGELTSKTDICYHCEVHPGDRYCPDPCPRGKSVKGPVEVTSVGSVTKEGGETTEGGVVSPAMCPRCGLRQLASSLTPEAAGRGLAYRETLTCVQCGYREVL